MTAKLLAHPRRIDSPAHLLDGLLACRDEIAEIVVAYRLRDEGEPHYGWSRLPTAKLVFWMQALSWSALHEYIEANDGLPEGGNGVA